MALPTKLDLEIVTPEGLLMKESVDEVIVPGELGYFGVLPGHTPFLSTLGLGQISYRVGSETRRLSCFWGFCEVLPARVAILAEIGERAEDIDIDRAEKARERAAQRLKSIKEEAGYEDAHKDYVKAVTRLAVARSQRS